MRILQQAVKMLRKTPLCDHCLGRQFALLGHGIGNDERGRAIKLALLLEVHFQAASNEKRALNILNILSINGFLEDANYVLEQMGQKSDQIVDQRTCYLCENKFDDYGELCEKALLQLGKYEYRNFLVGVELPKRTEEREDEFRSAFGVRWGEDMRNEFARIVGKRIAESVQKDVEFKKPEIVVLVNPFTSEVRLQVNPLFVRGRYRKLARGIPQSKWYCSNCRGKGCFKCGFTGKMYSESVEEFIGKPFLEATGGLASSFHAAGREDIDVLMLGSGRPFVLEISKPVTRNLDLARMRKVINDRSKDKVEISSLRLVDRDEIRRLKKGESTQKEYRVLIEFEEEITQRKLDLARKRLAGALILQQTPLRVMHRRADLTREKYIYGLDVKKMTPKRAEMKIRCQGGLYVKELVTGDEGRTKPSISSILRNPARPLKLDVLRVVLGD